ncbi:MAG: Alw26I/Eco31I/Esp3I family type II restriction adenine-specific DNA-methyltransferase [Paraclostridium sp.]
MELMMRIEDILPILKNINIDDIADIYTTVLEVAEDIIFKNRDNREDELYLNIEEYIKQKITYTDEITVNEVELLIQFINEVYQRSLEHETVESLLNNDSKKNNFRKNNGIYYTDLDLGKNIAKQTVQSYLYSNSGVDLREIKFLEPCVGSGIFVISYIDTMLDFNMKIDDILRNIYVVDIDERAVAIYKRLLKIYLYIKCNYTLDFEEHRENINTNGLLFKIEENEVSKINIQNVFNEVMNNGGFDIVITNPPYKLLKAEKNKYDTNENYENDKVIFKNIADYIKKNRTYNYSNEGTLNYYKLFIEEIIESYTKDNAAIGLLIPQNILADKSCTKLRKHIIENYNLDNIYIIPEKNEFFNDITQSLASMVVNKGKRPGDINIYTDIKSKKDLYKIDHITTNIDRLSSISETEAILPLKNIDWDILGKMHENKRIKEIEFIGNKRGELDLSINKKYLANNETPYRLLRGNVIGEYNLRKTEIFEYVDESFFVDYPNKREVSINKRIACQQISNVNQNKRLYFCEVPSDNVLGNSCNYVFVDNNNKYAIDIDSIMGILNSSLMNWRFKITSSNNHINNYEIDDLPIVLKNTPIYEEISDLVRKYLSNDEVENFEEKIDALVFKLYGLELEQIEHILVFNQRDKEYLYRVIYFMRYKDYLIGKLKKDIDNISIQNATEVQEIQYEQLEFGHPEVAITIEVEGVDEDGNEDTQLYESLLNDEISKEEFIDQIELKDNIEISYVNEILEKYINLYNYKILNHKSCKLSDLDIEMVQAIPPGGNWKNIPRETVEKSQRLVKITASGGRTTLYGRLHPDRASYTVTTYFNRPGNGTYIHPDYSETEEGITQNRVITFREAARLQSFTDDYLFVGTQGAILNQIGNAVPSILGYNIISQIKKYIDINNAVDLFCGAGGLSLGLCRAGIDVKVAVDIDKHACETYKLNHPETKVIQGDLTTDETKNEIFNSVDGVDVDLICGGPPCQGFSNAGLRMIDDPRNLLFKEFVTIVENKMPKVFIMENVEGLLSMNNGKTYESIIECFSNVGYKVRGHKLNAAEYGVPQKRKRVIIIGVRDDIARDCLGIISDENTNIIDKLFPIKRFKDNSVEESMLKIDDKQGFVTVKESISDLPRLENGTLGEMVMGQDKLPNSLYQLLVKNLISFEEFVKLRDKTK